MLPRIKDTSLPFSVLSVCLVLLVVVTPEQSAGRTNETPIPWSNTTGESILKRCEAYYFHYMRFAGEFIHCELANAVPFRMCGQCIKEYTLARATFHEILKSPDLDECRRNYLSADRVQIIPSIQKNIEAVWLEADCEGCSNNISVVHETEEVRYTIPGEVKMFMRMFENMTTCVKQVTGDWDSRDWLRLLSVGEKNESVCTQCLAQYNTLNQQYKAVSDHQGEGLCMDIIDMMNYTRHNWSMTFHCNHRTGNQGATVAITTVLATGPFLFYIILGLVTKQTSKKKLRQKRLISLTGSTIYRSSQSQLHLDQGSGDARLLSPVNGT